MSHTPQHALPTPATPKRHPVWLAIVAGLLAVSAGLVTYALWSFQGTTSGATVTAGDFELTLGNLTWQGDCGASSDPGASLDDLVLTAGQSVTLSQVITGRFTGDNLVVALNVGFAQSIDPLTATWHLEVGGVQIAPAPPAGDVSLATELTIPDLTQQSWVVVVTVSDPATSLKWVDPTATPAPTPQSVELGQLTIAAYQVRCGADHGFATPCPTASPTGEGGS
ncbi:MAG: hypothetical protein LBI33_06895 [Propionibacteriaceae bacterium]|jgi:alternate signal-mediated exported protein|nr:hypothetical protein [Propionibacteriaceae bacterium]